MDEGSCPTYSSSHDALECKRFRSQKEPDELFASVKVGENQPFNFVHSLYEGILAGGAAGVVAEAALYPVDTIKTRLQAAEGGGKIVLKGLYSGLAGNLAGALPASAIFLGIYEPTKQKLLQCLPEHLSAIAQLVRLLTSGNLMNQLFIKKTSDYIVIWGQSVNVLCLLFLGRFGDFLQSAGVIGGVVSSLIRVPTEVVKQRMQTGQFSSAPNAVRFIAAKEGFKGLYAGYGSFLVRDLPFDALQFCVYEQLLMGYKLAAQRDVNDAEIALIGAFAGAITGALTTPLDVVKTRLMIQGSRNQYKGIFDCAKTIVREEGPRALLKGMGPRVIWIGVGGSIFFGVLEKTKQMVNQKWQETKK